MAYIIQYSPQSNHHYPGVKARRRIPARYWLGLLILVTAACLVRFYGIPDFLIPGDPVVTRKAASLMMNELKEGISVNDAVTVFCKEILHGAGF